MNSEPSEIELLAFKWYRAEKREKYLWEKVIHAKPLSNTILLDFLNTAIPHTVLVELLNLCRIKMESNDFDESNDIELIAVGLYRTYDSGNSLWKTIKNRPNKSNELQEMKSNLDEQWNYKRKLMDACRIKFDSNDIDWLANNA